MDNVLAAIKRCQEVRTRTSQVRSPKLFSLLCRLFMAWASQWWRRVSSCELAAIGSRLPTKFVFRLSLQY